MVFDQGVTKPYQAYLSGSDRKNKITRKTRITRKFLVFDRLSPGRRRSLLGISDVSLAQLPM